MKKKLNCILLIDDDMATNFLHKHVIKKADCTEQAIAVTSGQEALDFLTKKEDGSYPQPDLIFVDINMPGMNGWEFIEAYKELDDEQQGKIVVIMLTTSLNPEDRDKAGILRSVKDFKHKPLSTEMLDEIIEKHFPDHL